jgi:hypothetical protein
MVENRILNCRIKIITSLAASFSQDIRGILLDFIFEVRKLLINFSLLFVVVGGLIKMEAIF